MHMASFSICVCESNTTGRKQSCALHHAFMSQVVQHLWHHLSSQCTAREDYAGHECIEGYAGSGPFDALLSGIGGWLILCRFGDWNVKETDWLNSNPCISGKPVVYLINLNEDKYIKKKSKWLPKVCSALCCHAADNLNPSEFVLIDSLSCCCKQSCCYTGEPYL